MRLLRYTPLAALVLWLASCDFQVPTSNEGLIDTLESSENLQAKADTLAKPAPDSLPVAGGKEHIPFDSASLAPSATINTRGTDPAQLVQFAQTLIGVPYVYGSTDPRVGFDCSGFITYVFNHFNIQVPRSSVDFTNVGREVPVAGAKPGDIILFRGTDSLETKVGHMGIVVSNTDTLRFIHSTSGKKMGVTITPLNKYYLTRFVKTIRVFAKNDG